MRVLVYRQADDTTCARIAIIAYANATLGLRADFVPRFATYDLNGRHAAYNSQYTLRTIH